MPDHARVTSLEAIEDFRAKLIVYRDKAGRVLDEINDEVTRTRLRLQTDWRAACEADIRRRQRELEQRQQELFSAQISVMENPTYVQQDALRKVRQGLRDAEAKLQLIKQWERAYDQRVETPTRQVEKLRHIVGKDLGMAVANLAETVKTLNAYAEMSPVTTAPKPAESEPPA
ncbi:MAG: hypothetical protein EXS35_07690 [Pedosphaera sp.]|nr:hypothetical protein [Pedosphaera sp.]